MSDVKVVKVRPGFWTGGFEEGTWDELDAETTVRALLISGPPLPEWIPEVGEEVRWAGSLVTVCSTPFVMQRLDPPCWCVQVDTVHGTCHASISALRPIPQPETVTGRKVGEINVDTDIAVDARCGPLPSGRYAIVDVDDES